MPQSSRGVPRLLVLFAVARGRDWTQWLLSLAEWWGHPESFNKCRCQGPVLQCFVLFPLSGDFNEQPELRLTGLEPFHHFNKEKHVVHSYMAVGSLVSSVIPEILVGNLFRQGGTRDIDAFKDGRNDIRKELQVFVFSEH